MKGNRNIMKNLKVNRALALLALLALLFSSPALVHAAPATNQVIAGIVVPANSNGGVTATCPAGSIITGGGWASNGNGALDIVISRATGNGWAVSAINTSAVQQPLRAVAICLSDAHVLSTMVSQSVVVAPNSSNSVVAACPSGLLVSGGGFNKAGGVSGLNVGLEATIGSNDWLASARNVTPAAISLFAHAMCLRGVTASSVEVASISVPANSTASVAATCQVGTLASGGGYRVGDVTVSSSLKLGNGWQITARNNTATSQAVAVIANCITP